MSTKKRAKQFNRIEIRRTANGYFVLVNEKYNVPSEYVFETGAGLFKFLRKHFCGGHK